MKKGLKIFLFVFIGCVVCIALYGVIRLINVGRKIGKFSPQYIYQNAYEYIDMNASDMGRLQFSFIAELEGDLYYVNEDDNLLYKTNCSGQDILSSSDQMKQMMFIDNFIVFHYDQELLVKNRTTD